MSIQIRRGVFETNSSSSHSLTMGQGDLAPMPFPEQMLRGGVVRVGPGSFQWEWKRYYTTAGKASYLLTQVAEHQLEKIINDRKNHACFDNDEQITLKLCQADARVAALRRVIEENTGCALVIEAGNDAWIGVDHESVGVGTEVFADDDTLARFLFDPTSYIETGNDNSNAPSRIECDDGQVEDYNSDRRVAVGVRRQGPGLR